MELGLDGDGGGRRQELGDEHERAELSEEEEQALEEPRLPRAQLRGASAAAAAAPAAAPAAAHSTAPASAAVMSLRLPPPTLGGGVDTGRQAAAAAAAAMSVAGDVGALQAAGPAPSPLLMPAHRRGGQPSGAGRAAAVVGSLLPTWREATPRGRAEEEAASSSETPSARVPAASARDAPAAVPAIDCMLRESALDRSSPWVASLRAHRSYWGSKDVMLFVLTRLVYGGEAAGGALGQPQPLGPEGAAPGHAADATAGASATCNRRETGR